MSAQGGEEAPTFTEERDELVVVDWTSTPDTELALNYRQQGKHGLRTRPFSNKTSIEVGELICHIRHDTLTQQCDIPLRLMYKTQEMHRSVIIQVGP